MADYNIDVKVQVEDSELDRTEQRIKRIKSQTIPVKVETRFEQKKINDTIKDVGRAVKKNGGNISDSIFGDSRNARKTLEALNSITKFKGKLDLGELNLSINSSILSNLDSLENKLREIKSLAGSMGSIKLSIADKIKTKDGKLIINGTKTSDLSVSKAQKEIAKNMKSIGALQKQYLDGNIDKTTYRSYKKSLGRRNTELFGLIRKNGNNADYVNTRIDTESARQKNRREKNNIVNNGVDYEKAISEYQRRKGIYESNHKIFGNEKTSPLDKVLNKGYKERLDNYKDTLKALQNVQSGVSSLKGEEKVKAYAKMGAYRKELNRQAKYLDNTELFYKRGKTKYSRSEFVGTDLDASSDAVQNKMRSMVSELAKGSKYTLDYNDAQKKMIATIDRGSGVMEKYQLAYKSGPGNIDQSLTKITQSVKPISSYISEIGNKFKTLSQYLISNFGFQALSTGLRAGIQSVVELDSAMVELKKTSNGTKQEYKQFTEEAKQNASNIGSTTAQITRSAADWSRIGMNLKDSQTMAKTTGILKNVSEFESIEEATSAMVGIMQAYKVDASDAGAIVDKLNKIGNTQPISTSELASGLQIAGSALEVQNNSMEQSMAIITAMNASTQDANQSARAARTVAMRLSGVSSKVLQEEGEDIEGLIESVPKLEAKIKSLTAINGEMGVSLTDSVGNFRSTYDILLDIAKKWKDIKAQDKKDGKNRANDLLETMANLMPVCTEMCIKEHI